MKRICIVVIPVVLFFFASCNRDIEEFKFTGKVIGAELCSSTQVSYIIDITSPDSIGDTIRLNSVRYDHAVIAYKSTRRLALDEIVNGVAYFTKDYAALNCVGVFNSQLPEIILLSVDEEP